MKLVKRYLLLATIISTLFSEIIRAQALPENFINPPREFSVMPFWFWNDTLKDDEIVRQIADFEAHGVYGFVIHPRIGLPENVKWLSTEMIHSMDVAIREASIRKMHVILYDEGMYPSGSSSGQVVARNPGYAARGLAKIDLKPGERLNLTEGKNLITLINRPNGESVAIVDEPSGGTIRGLHYLGEGSVQLKEESPPAGDILNPDAVTCFIELVYDRYAKEFGRYFGTTITGIFTDEPSPLGRSSISGTVPGNGSLLPQIKQILGYDITPFLADLWYNDNSDSKKHRADYSYAINICLEDIYYKRLSNWCKDHGISLMGHPAGSMDIEDERYFQIPGQDLVWRYVEPGPKALTGQNSTVAKCASSAMVHLGQRRNSIELYGAYGHSLSYDEMVWLADWCFVRGQNLLIPHAFFYSIRGPRFDERPPDVGQNSTWWSRYREYSDACRRLSWLNTDSKQICDVAILCESTFLPDKSARILYEHQRDFNYLEIRHLWEDARIDSKGVHIAGMNYGVLVIDSLSNIPPEAMLSLKILAMNGRLVINRHAEYYSLFEKVISYQTPDDLIAAINTKLPPDIEMNNPSQDIRYRHVVKEDNHYYIIFNEGTNIITSKLKVSATGKRQLIDAATAAAVKLSADETLTFSPHELKIIRVTN